jgi:hypothetical protein
MSFVRLLYTIRFSALIMLTNGKLVSPKFHSGEGRTPSEVEWVEIRRSVAKLKMELDRVHLDFSDVDSTPDNIHVVSQGNDIASPGTGLVSIAELQEKHDVDDGKNENCCRIADEEAAESS